MMPPQDQIAERMEKYARASGHPRLVELLSRHANDQKEKFTLSDDEDQACTGSQRQCYMLNPEASIQTLRPLALDTRIELARNSTKNLHDGSWAMKLLRHYVGRVKDHNQRFPPRVWLWDIAFNRVRAPRKTRLPSPACEILSFRAMVPNFMYLLATLLVISPCRNRRKGLRFG